MHAQLAKWLTEKYDTKKPFFLFLNYIEAHQQYRPPRDMLRVCVDRDLGPLAEQKPVRSIVRLHADRRRLAVVEGHHGNGIPLRRRDPAISTARWANCWSTSRATGLDENTLVIITADHGEHFGEHHRLSHHYSLYEPLVRVPLIVRYADRFKGGEEEKLVQSHDVYPTILELAGWNGSACRDRRARACWSRPPKRGPASANT